MYSITIRDFFSGAHNLRGYEGKCENLHGHNWRVEVSLSKNVLNKTGMVMDFKAVKKILSEVLGKFDHKYLNEVEYFKTRNPTSENMARCIFDSLSVRLDGLSRVTVWETDTSSASYSGEGGG